jgi:DNA helicase IV
VINVNSGNHGMPATRGDDPIMAALLTRLDDFPFAEERRLFYVAITRARNKTILFADARSISKFIFEINPKLTGTGAKVCPKCHRGILLKRRRRDGKVYYACSNFSGGCRYTE